jgi:hypothetical protein
VQDRMLRLLTTTPRFYTHLVHLKKHVPVVF